MACFEKTRLPVRQHVELRPRTRRRDGVDVEHLRDLGRETRGPCVVPASGGAVQDLDAHGTTAYPGHPQATLARSEGGDHTGARLAAPADAILGMSTSTCAAGRAQRLGQHAPSVSATRCPSGCRARDWLHRCRSTRSSAGFHCSRRSCRFPFPSPWRGARPRCGLSVGRGRCTAGSTASRCDRRDRRRSRPVRGRPGRLPRRRSTAIDASRRTGARAAQLLPWRAARRPTTTETCERDRGSRGQRSTAGAATDVWEAALEAAWRGPPRLVSRRRLRRQSPRRATGGSRRRSTSAARQSEIPPATLLIAWTFLVGRESRCLPRSRSLLDDATWARGRGWALWKALITHQQPGADVAARRFGWRVSAREVVEDVIADHRAANT